MNLKICKCTRAIEMSKNFFKENKLLIFIFILSSLVPFVSTLESIYFGRIAFWFDPGRDFLLALQNFKNPTLIGQPSGLPGLFYGPYWIWFISIFTLFSKDPRVVSFLLLTIPYFTIFPYFLYKISKKWGIFVFISLWFLFISNFGGYASQIWNVNYTPLFLIIAVYCITIPSGLITKKKINYILGGISVGLVANFHLSLGIPTIAAFFLSLVLIYLLENKKNIIKLSKDFITKIFLFGIGVVVSFLPFFLFEARHDFVQAKTFLSALRNSIIYNTASVGQTGMNDQEILRSFFERFSNVLGIPSELGTPVFISLISLSLIVLIFRRKLVSVYEKRLLILLFTISIVLLASFIVNKNPIWEYYFTGTEVLFLLLIGFCFSKLSFGKYILIIFILLTIFSEIGGFRKMFKVNDYSNSDLGTKTFIVKSIFEDAGTNFYYYAYSSAIYTYEYDYLFGWKDEEEKNKKLNKESNLIYLIIPNVGSGVEEDFINYKAPNKKYTQIKKWDIPDGTSIYKMIKTGDEESL